MEHRGAAAEPFGRGRKRRMPFGDLVAAAAGGDASLYLTTQEAAVGPDGHPEVFAPPASRLAADFPLRPALLGALVPQAVNVWMGCAPEGASSGLHHDFHDNLYALLRGKKRFRLFPPSLLERMYTHGTPLRVHPNGRVVYEGQGDVGADGADVKEAARWQAQRRAERGLQAAEAAAASGAEGGQARLRAANRALDAVLEAALDDGFDSIQDDFEELDGEGGGPAAGAGGDPPSFSRVDLSLPPRELRARFPLFPGAAAALECEVGEGQMLYLPAGWSHEVTSFSGPRAAAGDGPRRDGRQAPASSSHLALNYWVHPPDNLDPSPAGYAAPYRSTYWEEVWAGREQRYEAMAAGANRMEEGPPQRGRGAEGGTAPGRGRELSPGARAHALRGMRGCFGFGRRQHLCHFVGFRVREDSR